MKILSEQYVPLFMGISRLINYLEKTYLQMKAIVTPYNETVDDINNHMLSMLHGDPKTYLVGTTYQIQHLMVKIKICYTPSSI